MIIAVCSLSGAPGVTTLATALAAVWPTGPLTVPVLVEADASGGDLAVWHRLSGRPGLVSLAASVRAGTAELSPAEERGTHRALFRHSAEIPGGLRAVTAPPTAHEASAVVAALAHRIQILRGGVSVVDLGRVMPGTAGAHLLSLADVAVVTVAGDDAAQIYRLSRCRDVLDALAENGTTVGLAVRDSRFSAAEITAETGFPVWAELPHDPTGAGYLRGEFLRPRGLRERFTAWSHTRQDPDTVEWMPLLACARRLANRVDDLPPACVRLGHRTEVAVA
ncbi:hypothetical protein Q8791_10055 [Nocardiopsis sp. CT-R113]|uniref:Uncharacterized protein n=1 Tax=Nocardiopsis codii TaxID=3065942 RepID=A0ABU7K5N6_9ACTN|nr:hypothetical protein [Nocardiopsis sp. CT-R113]MEE2037563.1 hypothetical protein [Nocardiopsis sp. CT-R113]